MTPPPLRILSACAVAGLFLIAGPLKVRGAAPPQAAGEIIVDFAAVSADGRPVADLKASDLSLKVAGKVRAVKSLQLVRVDAGTGGAAPSAGLPPPFATNEGSGGSSPAILLVIEDESLRPGAERDLREQLGKFLDGLPPSARVSLATAPRDVARVGFGAGIGRVREALGQITGRMPASMSNGDRLCRTRDTLLMLRSQLASLSGAETPTTVIVFSSAMSVPGSDNACEVTTQHFQQLGPAAAAARANVYVVQQDPNITARNDGLENLAGVSGAGAVLRISAATSPLTRIATETSAYYVATLEADSSDRAGQSQRLELKVNREGVTTRSRSELFVARAAPGAAAKGGTTAPNDMLRVVQPFRDLPLRMAVFISRAPGDNKLAPTLGVMVMAEPIDPTVKIAAAGAALVDDAGGKVVVRSTLDEKQLGGRPMVALFGTTQGRYRLRFAAVDAAGRSGAVDQEVSAELTPAGPLKLGALVLTAFRNNSAVPALVFRDEEKIVGVMEMYGQLTANIAARMEVASSLDGTAISTVQPGGRQTSEPDKFILTGEIPIASLAPGDYVVRAFVMLEGQPEGKVIRTFRKLPK